MLETNDAEDAKLFIAALESFQTGTITPLLKEELKYSIQTRRLAEGKEELFVEASETNKSTQELRPDEIEKKERRKEQNRRAATRFRNKRKGEISNMQLTRPGNNQTRTADSNEERISLCSQLETRNQELRGEVARLKQQRSLLRTELSNILEEKCRTQHA